MICWSWWRSGLDRGPHRCDLMEGHDGLHHCCCGAVSEYIEQPKVKNG